jgi:uncharacterized membrane protein YoaT (DUF817 family)
VNASGDSHAKTKANAFVYFSKRANRKALIEFWHFGLKEARACIFAGSFFLILAASKVIDTHALLGLYRYDAILLAALLLQAALLITRVESVGELKIICIFHFFGFALEVFKTQPEIGSWSYPELGYTKLFGVPLYSGFMYAAVASYMMQAWRLFDLALERPPAVWLANTLALAAYLNFFTHHAPHVPDLRWLIGAALLLAYRHTWVYFTPRHLRLRMPLGLSFLLIGFFVWIAENIASFFGAWIYPHQKLGWAMVRFDKLGAWSLLVVLTFVIVAAYQRRLANAR